MNRKYSIGFLIGIIIILALFVIGYRFSYNRGVKERELTRNSSATELEEGYYINVSNGYVTVYLSDKKTVYEYTSILAEELPLELRQELDSGIKVDTLSEVYGFLENYSS